MRKVSCKSNDESIIAAAMVIAAAIALPALARSGLQSDNVIAMGDKDQNGARGESSQRAPKCRAAVKRTPILLEGAQVSVTLEPQPEREGAVALGIPACVHRLESSHHLYLVARGLRADAPQGVLYNLYLDLPANPTREQLKTHKVGVLNFFDAVGRGKTEKGKDADPVTPNFDVTEVLKALESKGLLKEKPTLTIIPAGKPVASANPVIAGISLVEQ
jgi:hypothetical protein